MLSPSGFGEGEGLILRCRGCRVWVLGWGFPLPRWGRGTRTHCSFSHRATSFGGWAAFRRGRADELTLGHRRDAQRGTEDTARGGPHWRARTDEGEERGASVRDRLQPDALHHVLGGLSHGATLTHQPSVDQPLSESCRRPPYLSQAAGTSALAHEWNKFTGPSG